MLPTLGIALGLMLARCTTASAVAEVPTTGNLRRLRRNSPEL
eukprot:COSAG04_NODE_11566_length_701_cov_1.617940_1_plen_41_part_10